MMANIETDYMKGASQVFQLVQTARQVQIMNRSDNQRTTPVTILLLAVAKPNTAKVEITDDQVAVYQTLDMNAFSLSLDRED